MLRKQSRTLVCSCNIVDLNSQALTPFSQSHPQLLPPQRKVMVLISMANSLQEFKVLKQLVWTKSQSFPSIRSSHKLDAW